MKYFKTSLPLVKIKDYLNAVTDATKDFCIVEIENKKSIIVTISDSVSSYLLKNAHFSNIQLTQTDISVIKIVHKIRSVWGNPKLFEATEMV
ncbi:hypothetical protein BH11BAC6_BH11BAC6_15940 [soil metagenome]